MLVSVLKLRQFAYCNCIYIGLVLHPLVVLTSSRKCSGWNNGRSSAEADWKSRIVAQKVNKNAILTNHFIIFYCLYEFYQLFYFFKGISVFIDSFFLYFVSLFIKEWIQWLVFFGWCKLVFLKRRKTFFIFFI